MSEKHPLKIGILLQNAGKYGPEAGGGYSVYSRLISSIDKKNDWKDIEFVFIYITYSSEKDPGPGKKDLQKEIITIDLQKLDKGIHFFFRLYTRLDFIPYFKRLARKRLPMIRIINKNIVEAQLAKNKIDLIYFPIHDNPHYNYPYVLTNWDVGHLSMHSFPEVAMNGTFEERDKHYQNHIRKAFGVFCESETGRNELIHYTHVNKERVFITPAFPGAVIETKVSDQEQAAILKKFDLERKKFFFYPAQFWSHKNHYNLLCAFSELLKKHPGLKLVFTGSDKGNLAYIRGEIAGMGLEQSVRYLGFVSLPEVYTLYKNCIALTMTTFLGPTNLPLLEAAALGCPVIASDLAGHRELLEEYAAYVDPASPESILQAMLKEISKADSPGVPYVNPKFTMDACLSSLQDNFLKLKPYRRAFGFHFGQY